MDEVLPKYRVEFLHKGSNQKKHLNVPRSKVRPMANPKENPFKSIFSHFKHGLISGLQWLTKPDSTLPESLIHRSALLAWTLLVIILLALAAIIVIPPDIPQYSGYIVLILSLVFIFMVAFILNRRGHYRFAAVLTIAGGVMAPWGSLIIDPVVQQGDIIPLNYVVIPVLLSSILLPPVFTAMVAAIQLAALGLVVMLIPASVTVNWVSFFTFIIIISVIIILASMIRQRDLKQIDRQKRLLILSEAKLREQSIRDYLTDLYNRRYLDETLAREIRRAKRAEFPVGFIMLDIDHFKRFNDKYGHAAGDIVLKEIADLLKSKIRYADIICRYGGEEFVVIMPEASLKITRQRAEELQEEVKQLNLHYKDQDLGLITLSAGVAIFPDHGASGKAVLRAADTALYTAKDSGRDRVVVAS